MSHTARIWTQDQLTAVIKPDAKRQPHTQHRTLPLHQRTQGNTTMKKTTLVHHRTTLITTGFYSTLAGGTR